MPKVTLGINFTQDLSLKELIRWWREAEELGYAWMGIPDSPIRFHGHYVTLTAFAMSTKKMPFAAMVTNPVTRHPSTVAGELFSLMEIAPGRVSFGIGTGDTAVYRIGLKGSTVEYLRGYIRAIRGLLRGEEVEWEGARFKPEWKDWTPPRDIKIYIAVAGPKVLRMAAEEVDGIVVAQLPYDRAGIDYVNGIIAEGCRAAGRKVSDLDVWYHPTVRLGPSRQELRRNLTVSTSWLARFTTEGKLIPDEYREAVRKVAAVRDMVSATEMAKQLGIYDWLVDRLGPLMGNIEEIAEGIQRLSDLGIKKIMLLPVGGSERIGVARAVAPLIKRFS